MTGDVFYFDYGVIVCWGLSQAAERDVIRSLAGPALVDPLSTQEVGFGLDFLMEERHRVALEGTSQVLSHCPTVSPPIPPPRSRWMSSTFITPCTRSPTSRTTPSRVSGWLGW